MAASGRPPAAAPRSRAGLLERRNVLVGILFGCGIIAFIDEAVFHQLLHWHHFYDRSTSDAGLVSDGLFHAFSWFATVASLFLFADLRRRNALIGWSFVLPNFHFHCSIAYAILRHKGVPLGKMDYLGKIQ